MNDNLTFNSVSPCLTVLLFFAFWPAIAAANPIGFDPVSAIASLLLESLFFALALKAFGFRGSLILIVWFVVTSMTWFSFIGAPLGTFAAIVTGDVVASGDLSAMLYVAYVVLTELVVCIVEAVILLFAGKLKLFRVAEKATVKPAFAIIFKIAVLGNLVSVLAGAATLIESSAGLLLFLGIAPLLMLANHLTLNLSKAERAGASSWQPGRTE
ncbi:MAG: hypothetical protein KKB51_23755 [Candidatus Riflebacteria bacterium]|nr:hypothetical protein [Candidatus Riflebacteria bacterium]